MVHGVSLQIGHRGDEVRHEMMGLPTSAAQLAMQESLLIGFSAQQKGRLFEAAERYEQVLVQDPAHFDATHMLGVVQYHRGRFDDALRLLTRATQLRPDVIEARGNLEIVEMARQRERQLCRAVLPRLRPLVQWPDEDAALLAKASAVDLVITQTVASQDEPFLNAVLEAVGRGRVQLWADANVSRIRDINVAIASADSHPTGGTLIFFGTEFSPWPWLDTAPLERTLLVVTRDEPGQLIDRIRELSGNGCRRVGLLCAGATLARRMRLPAQVLVPQPSAASSGTP